MKQIRAEKFPQIDTSQQIEGVRIGKVVGVEADGKVLVDFPGNTQSPLAARFANALKLDILRWAASSSRDVLLIFENNDPHLPIILDMLHSYLDEITEAQELELPVEDVQNVTVDGQKISFEAKEQIVLKCGKASITLTNAGKILIRGAYLMNHSSGVNRIRGGSVQIN